VPQDDAEAVKWFRKAADQGDPYAQFNLGNMYAEARGVPQDDAETVKCAVNLEHVLGEIKTNRGNLHVDGSLM
jgi:hypothetical protein